MQLDKYLEKNNLTDQQFSCKSGCSLPTIRKLKYGVGRCHMRTALAVERATDGEVSIDELMSDGLSGGSLPATMIDPEALIQKIKEGSYEIRIVRKK